MKVETLRRTPQPEKLVCQYARGDYWDGYVPDTPYDELMAGVTTEPRHRAHALGKADKWRSTAELLDDPPSADDLDGGVLLRAKERSLIEDLITKGHWGPFEHPQLNLQVRGASRALMAQITRHRHLTFDIQSQRYVDFGAKDDPVKTPATLRADPDVANTVNREKGLTEIDPETRAELRETANESVGKSLGVYDHLIENGVPKEDARFYLPIGTTVNIGVSGNARALLHVMNMRMQGDAQWEARELSGMVLDEFADWMPATYEMFEEHGPFRLAP